jgi:Cu/Ag efflux protein CusF
MATFRNIAFAAFVAALPAGAPTFLLAQGAPLVSGEVKKVDASAKKITIKHGPIKNLDMNESGMTMVFAVQDPAMLTSVKPGDKIKFSAERVGGIITVTRIQK